MYVDSRTNSEHEMNSDIEVISRNLNLGIGVVRPLGMGCN